MVSIAFSKSPYRPSSILNLVISYEASFNASFNLSYSPDILIGSFPIDIENWFRFSSKGVSLRLLIYLIYDIISLFFLS